MANEKEDSASRPSAEKADGILLFKGKVYCLRRSEGWRKKLGAPSQDGSYGNAVPRHFNTHITSAQTKASKFVTPDGLAFAGNYDLLLVSPELEPKAKEICGPNSRLIPEKNPDADAGENAANPIYGMKYLVVGGGGIGFTGKK